MREGARSSAWQTARWVACLLASALPSAACGDSQARPAYLSPPEHRIVVDPASSTVLVRRVTLMPLVPVPGRPGVLREHDAAVWFRVALEAGDVSHVARVSSEQTWAQVVGDDVLVVTAEEQLLPELRRVDPATGVDRVSRDLDALEPGPVALSPDARWLLLRGSLGAGGVRLVDVETLVDVALPTAVGELVDAAWSGARLVLLGVREGRAVAGVWDPAALAVGGAVALPSRVVESARTAPHAIVTSPDGRWAAWRAAEGPELLDLDTGELHALEGNAGDRLMVFSEDGARLAQADGGGEVSLLDTRTLEPLSSPLPLEAAEVTVPVPGTDRAPIARSWAGLTAGRPRPWWTSLPAPPARSSDPRSPSARSRCAGVTRPGSPTVRCTGST